MQKRISYNKNIFIIAFLFIANILIIFIAPFIGSNFEGVNIADIPINIEFKVGFFGNWLEHRIFIGDYDAFLTGSSGEIGVYLSSAVAFLVLLMIFSFIGLVLSGISVKSIFEQEEFRKKRLLFILKIIDAIALIIAGLFGILSLIMLIGFKNSIIQPYADLGGFKPADIPTIKFTVGYYLSLIIAILYILIGLYEGTLSIASWKKKKLV